MSFDSNGCLETARIGNTECRPDYESQAASLKLKLDAAIQLKEALINFFYKNGVYDFRNISSFAEMVGGVEIVKLQLSAYYVELLKKVEEEETR